MGGEKIEMKQGLEMQEVTIKNVVRYIHNTCKILVVERE